MKSFLLSLLLLTPTLTLAQYNYSEVLDLAILFFKAERSGPLPYIDPRVPYRVDSALNDRGLNGEDLTGGYYDAGDYVKFGFPMASSMTLMAWSVVEHREKYEAAGLLDDALEAIKWGTDYFIKAHTGPTEFYAQVADGHLDHAFWGRPEEMNYSRESFRVTAEQPGTDVVGETSAAMSAAAIAFRGSNPAYADELLVHATELFDFAYDYRGFYDDVIPAGDFYGSTQWYDELAWAAAWLGRATGESRYIQEAEAIHEEFGIDQGWGQSWDEKFASTNILLAQLTGNEKYRILAERYLIDEWGPGGAVPYTPRGLAWRLEWGSLRYAANTAMMAVMYSTYLKTTGDAQDLVLADDLHKWAQDQVNYMLGDGGRSYVVGYGNNPPTQPHHASSSCPAQPSSCTFDQLYAPGPNPFTLYGALVGGPGINDDYIDVRTDYQKNEVACDYNAGFIGVLAGLL